MGWYGGTRVFDTVASSLVDMNVSTPCHSYEDFLREVLDPLLVELEDMDWDNHSESAYYDHPVIGRILGNDFYDEELEDEDE